MERLLSGEPMDKLEDNSRGGVRVENRGDRLGSHLVDDLEADAHGGPLMVCDHAEELEIEDVKLGRLVDGDLLEKRLAENGHRDRLDLLVECYELPN